MLNFVFLYKLFLSFYDLNLFIVIGSYVVRKVNHIMMTHKYRGSIVALFDK